MRPTVIWWNSEGRGSWSCCHCLNEMFDLYECEHYFPSWNGLRTPSGAIIVLHGGNAQLNGKGPETAREINDFAGKFAWTIFINIGDETSEFPVHLLQHPNSRLWLQTPLPSQKADRYLLEGYTHGTEKQATAVKDLDWFFAGQITHDRRISCFKALQTMKGGVLRGTNGFGQGYLHDDYNSYMNRAKIVPCPSGPSTPDSFRMCEALECGAIPIIDAVSLNPATKGFWDLVLPGHPFTVVEDWSTLSDVMGTILTDYERIQRLTQHWWKSYKLKYRNWLAQDLAALGAR